MRPGFKGFRFIDDCFKIYDNQIFIKDFSKELINLHPSIQFMMAMSNDRFSFIDLLLTLSGKVIPTDLDYNPTDTYAHQRKHSLLSITENNKNC